MMNSFPVNVNERAGYIRPCSYCNRVYVKPRASAGHVRDHKAEIRKIENDFFCPRCSAETFLSLNPETANVTPQATPGKCDSSRRRPGKKNKAGQCSGKDKVSTSADAEIEKGPKRCKITSSLSIESVMPRKEELQLLEYMQNTFVKLTISDEAPADVDLSLHL